MGKTRLVVMLTALVLSSCSSTPGASVTRVPVPTETPTPTVPSVIWPQASWPISSPEALGFDANELSRMVQAIELGAYGYVDRFVVVRRGQIAVDVSFEHDYEQINETYDASPHPYNYHSTVWHPYYQDSDLHTLQSVTKSVVSLLIGIAIDRGELPGTDVRVMDYFADYAVSDLDGRKQGILLEDLLTMRSGLDWNEWEYPFDDPRNVTIQMEASDDWIQFVLDRPMAFEPGEVWAYSSGASQLLSVILWKSTGEYADANAEKHLFAPLGIRDYYWKKTPGGWPDTEGGLYLRTEDLAKIGYLVQHDGRWDGVQIVSEDWLRASTDTKVGDIFPEDPIWDWNYGYMWWSIDVNNAEIPRVIYAAGYGGQYLFIVPELDLLTVFNGWNIYEDKALLIDLFIQWLLPSLE